MKHQYFFVKSFEEDFHTKTLKGKKKVNFQSLENIVRTNCIRPNTKSFGQESRLSTTILSKNYLKTYRSQGIIFQTNEKPAYVLPFDLVVLSDAKKIIVHYYMIKENIHIYYNHKLIPGFEKFLFKDFESLLNEFPSHEEVWKAINLFREKNGLKKLPLSKHRLIEYNEAVFEKPIRIKPVALYGYKKNAKFLAKKFKLAYFRTARDFYKKTVLE
jgi:hypothetical protein